MDNVGKKFLAVKDGEMSSAGSVFKLSDSEQKECAVYEATMWKFQVFMAEVDALLPGSDASPDTANRNMKKTMEQYGVSPLTLDVKEMVGYIDRVIGTAKTDYGRLMARHRLYDGLGDVEGKKETFDRMISLEAAGESLMKKRAEIGSATIM